ncbi:unnamed protein product [Somion occarium]|uniref:F-box protein n=1 Tax=Somion occarium TaxID=3059160 RepID=A0ABP1CYB0_9APHY
MVNDANLNFDFFVNPIDPQLQLDVDALFRALSGPQLEAPPPPYLAHSIALPCVTAAKTLPYLQLSAVIENLMTGPSIVGSVKNLHLAVSKGDDEDFGNISPIPFRLEDNPTTLPTIKQLVLQHVDLTWRPSGQQPVPLRQLHLTNFPGSHTAHPSMDDLLAILRACPRLTQLSLSNVGPDLGACFVNPSNQVSVPNLEKLCLHNTVINIHNVLARLEVPDTAKIHLKTSLTSQGSLRAVHCLPKNHQLWPLHKIETLLITSGRDRGGVIVEGFSDTDILPFDLARVRAGGKQKLTMEFLCESGSPRTWLGCGDGPVAADVIAEVLQTFQNVGLSHVQIRCPVSSVSEAEWSCILPHLSSTTQLTLTNIEDTRQYRVSGNFNWLKALSFRKYNPRAGVMGTLCPKLDHLTLYGLVTDTHFANELCNTLRSRLLNGFKLTTLTMIQRHEGEGLQAEKWKQWPIQDQNLVAEFIPDVGSDGHKDELYTDVGPGFCDY